MPLTIMPQGCRFPDVIRSVVDSDDSDTAPRKSVLKPM